jgi:hypothetical protein
VFVVSGGETDGESFDVTESFVPLDPDPVDWKSLAHPAMSTTLRRNGRVLLRCFILHWTQSCLQPFKGAGHECRSLTAPCVHHEKMCNLFLVRLSLVQSSEFGSQSSEVSGSQGANFTAGDREAFANRSREAGDSVLVKTEK